MSQSRSSQALPPSSLPPTTWVFSTAPQRPTPGCFLVLPSTSCSSPSTATLTSGCGYHWTCLSWEEVCFTWCELLYFVVRCGRVFVRPFGNSYVLYLLALGWRIGRWIDVLVCVPLLPWLLLAAPCIAQPSKLEERNPRCLAACFSGTAGLERLGYGACCWLHGWWVGGWLVGSR